MCMTATSVVALVELPMLSSRSRFLSLFLPRPGFLFLLPSEILKKKE